MGDATTFSLTFGVIIGLLLVLAVIYYLSSMARNVYEVKIEVLHEVDLRMEELSASVEKELSQRAAWMRTEVNDAVRVSRKEILAEIGTLRGEVTERIEKTEKATFFLQNMVGLPNAPAAAPVAPVPEAPPDAPPPTADEKPAPVARSKAAGK